MSNKDSKKLQTASKQTTDPSVTALKKSPLDRLQIIQKVKPSLSTPESKSHTIKDVYKKTVVHNLKEHLELMKLTAQSVLEKASLPTGHTIATNHGYTTPQEMAKSQFGESSDEYYAASILFFCSHIQNAIKQGNAEAAALFSIQATAFYQELLIDPNAYAIGLKILEDKKNQEWISQAITIMEKKGYSEKQLISHSKTITFSQLAHLVVKSQTQSGLKADDVTMVRNALVSYFKS